MNAFLIALLAAAAAPRAGSHALEAKGFVDLPAHKGSGGFDHADVDVAAGRLYVAHTANDAVDVIDVEKDRYVESLAGYKAVAGVLVGGDPPQVFTSNRGDDTISILPAKAAVSVAAKPNGLSFDPGRGLLLVAHAATPGAVVLVDVNKRSSAGQLTAPGRTRWTVFDPGQQLFFVNISDPPLVIAIDPKKPGEIARRYKVAAAGPHGLALDGKTGHLLVACDAARMVALDAKTGAIRKEGKLSGAPDVIFLDEGRRVAYVAVGSPGVIDVVDADALTTVETVRTEAGAHTLALDARRGKVYAFLPKSHRAAVFRAALPVRQ